MHPMHYSQTSTANAGAMMTTAGQVIATPTGNFSQQILPGLVSTNGNKFVILGQYEAAAAQQTLGNVRSRVTACKKKEKNCTLQNQLPVFQNNPIYASIVPVQSSSQILSGCHIREVPSQPQIMTTQASGTMLNQPQILGLRTVNAFPPGLSWAHSGFHVNQNPFIIYNQPSGMTVHPVQSQTAMPLAATAMAIPSTTIVAPQLMPKGDIVKESSCVDQQNQLPSNQATEPKSIADNQTGFNLGHLVNDQTKFTGIENTSGSVGTEISSSEQSQAAVVPISEILQESVASIPTVDVSVVSTPPSTFTSEPCVGGNPSPSNTEMVTINTEINHSTPVELYNSDIESCTNSVQGANYLKKCTGIESKTMSVETQISSGQKSQASIIPLSMLPPACIALAINTSSVSLTYSPLTTLSSTDANPMVPSSYSSSIQKHTMCAELNQMLPTSISSQNSDACIASTVCASVSVTSSPLTTVSSTDANPLAPSNCPSSIQTHTTCAEMNQMPPTSITLENFDTCNEILSNPIQLISNLAKSTENEIRSVSAKTNISSNLESQAIVAPVSKFVQTCIGTTPIVNASVVSMAPSTFTIASSTMSPVTTSAVSCTSNVPIVSPDSPMLCWSNQVSDFNSRPPLLKVHNEAIVTSCKANEIETMVTDESSKPSPLVQELSLECFRDKQSLTNAVKPKVLTHIINGFVIYESSEPFPVNQSPLSDLSCKVLPPKKLNIPEEKENSLAVPNSETKIRNLRPRSIVELGKCEFCAKQGTKFRFVRSKRFCSKSCTKQFNKHSTKKKERQVPTIQGHVGSGGPGRKRKGFRKKRYLQKQLPVEIKNTNAMQGEEILPSSENELTVSYKTDEENSALFEDSHHTPMEVEESSEVKLVESDLTQKFPSKWTVQDVFEFIQSLPGCSDYADNFKSQEVDGQALLLLNEVHLKTALSMKLGPALKLLSQIRSLKTKIVATFL